MTAPIPEGASAARPQAASIPRRRADETGPATKHGTIAEPEERLLFLADSIGGDTLFDAVGWAEQILDAANRAALTTQESNHAG